MSLSEYTPKTWVSDDPITDAELNRLEDRVEEVQKIYQNVFDINNPPTWETVKNMLDNKVFPALVEDFIEGKAFKYILWYYSEPQYYLYGSGDEQFGSYSPTEIPSMNFDPSGGVI